MSGSWSFCFILNYFIPSYTYFNSESEHVYLMSIHTVVSYDLKLFIVNFLFGHNDFWYQVALVALNDTNVL